MGAGGAVGAGGSMTGAGGGGGAGTGGAGAGGKTGAGGVDGGTIVSFSEDFEAGNYARWSLGPSTTMTYAISSPGANGTAHSFQITGVESTGYDGPNIIFPNAIQPTRVSFWVEFGPSPLGDGACYFALAGDDRAIDHMLVLVLSQTSGPYLITGGAFPQVQLIANRWYHFEFTLNWSSRIFTTTIDGNVVAPNSTTTIAGTSTGFKRIDLFNTSSSALVFWDEIVLD
jgi:hypothetical protein